MLEVIRKGWERGLSSRRGRLYFGLGGKPALDKGDAEQ